MMKKTITIRSGQLTEERRLFLKKTGSLAIMSLMGLSFFTACAPEDDIVPDNNNQDNQDNDDDEGDDDNGIDINGNTITIDLDIVTDLQNAGGWLLIVEAQTLVVNDGNIKALTSVCTHSACDRNWQFNNNQFRCTCHGSVFTTDGQVVNGPANRALDNYSVTVEDNLVTINK